MEPGIPAGIEPALVTRIGSQVGSEEGARHVHLGHRTRIAGPRGSRPEAGAAICPGRLDGGSATDQTRST